MSIRKSGFINHPVLYFSQQKIRLFPVRKSPGQKQEAARSRRKTRVCLGQFTASGIDHFLGIRNRTPEAVVYLYDAAAVIAEMVMRPCDGPADDTVSETIQRLRHMYLWIQIQLFLQHRLRVGAGGKAAQKKSMIRYRLVEFQPYLK